MANKDNHIMAGALMMVAGGAIGAGLALLYAPQSGRRTRRQIRGYAHKVRNEAEQMASDLTDSVSDMVEEIGEKTGELTQRGGEVAEGMRRDLLRNIERGEKQLERQRKRLNDMWG